MMFPCDVLVNENPQDIENDKKTKDIGNEVAKSTISRVKENKERRSIQNVCESEFSVFLRRYSVFLRQYSVFLRRYSVFLRRYLNNLVTKEMIKLRALEVNRLNNGPETFVTSDGWLTKFKKYHGIRILLVCRESMSCKVELAISFKNKFKNYIAENGFLPEQIYVCDEPSFIYKRLPNKINVTNFEKTAAGRKAMKERVTIMRCVNATVTRHFESKNLPVKALLLINNATCLVSENNFTGNPIFKVMFFPLNDSPLLQPLDQSVIKSLKQRHRKHLFACLGALSAEDGTVSAQKNINLNDVIYLVVQAWNEIPVSVIQNSFKHHFLSSDEIKYNFPSDHFSEEDDILLARLYNSIFNDCNLADTKIMK
ncbi:jerky protein homolog-like [Hydra vulgaris]|uniref:Jerky protein homolog-like n=1 Tax=Hydra vulgaris TaxID=6087 RepID=A0ABM4DMH0_HYDVU